MSTGREYFSAVYLGGLIYALNGGSSMESYDPMTNQWTGRASTINSRIYGDCAAAVDGYIYAAGCSNTNAERYDPSLDTWNPITSLPCNPAEWTQTESLQGKLYVLGGKGSCNGDGFAAVQRYDPQTDSWSYAQRMLSTHENFAAAASETHIYVLGGWNTKCERYDPVTDTWAYLPDTPGWMATGGGDAVFIDGYLWAIAGSGSNGISQIAIKADDGMNDGDWVQMADMAHTGRGYGIQSVAVRLDNPPTGSG